MDRKNINRGFKKLRVWQDAVSLYVLACKIFNNFLFELKKIAGNSIDAAHSISRNISEGYCRRSLKEYLNHLNIMNRKSGLNLLVHGATEAIQQWARDIKGMRMGIHSYLWRRYEMASSYSSDRHSRWPQSRRQTLDCDRPQISHVPRGAKKTMEVSGHHPNEKSPS